MTLADRPDLVSLILGGSVALAALALMASQIRDRKRRDDDLSEEDDGYFGRQDKRRLMGGLVMLLLAAGVVIGTRIDPGMPGHPNLDFVKIWLVVGVLLLFLLGLALRDWFETRRYAIRHREILRLARLQLLEAELNRRRAAKVEATTGEAAGNGRAALHPGEEIAP
jgi:hypothetical protein